MQPRNNSIDLLKFIGILAVVLGHIASPFSHFIFSWHMPLFFMLAGFFIRFEMNPPEFFKKEFRRLFIPYFIFALIGLAAEVFKRAVLHRDPLFLPAELKGIFWSMNIEGLGHHYGFVLWFLPALFWARSSLFLLNRWLKRDEWLLAISIALFVLSFYGWLPFGVDVAMNAFLWVFLGNQFYRRLPRVKIEWVSPIVLLGVALVFGYPFLDLATKNYGQPWLNLVWAIAFVSALYSACSRVRLPVAMREWTTVWGKETMILFILHPYTNNVASLIFEKIGFENAWWAKLAVSLILLQGLLMLKIKNAKWGVIRYV